MNPLTHRRNLLAHERIDRSSGEQEMQEKDLQSVADEIGKLAANSAEAAEQIQKVSAAVVEGCEWSGTRGRKYGSNLRE